MQMLSYDVDRGQETILIWSGLTDSCYYAWQSSVIVSLNDQNKLLTLGPILYYLATLALLVTLFYLSISYSKSPVSLHHIIIKLTSYIVSYIQLLYTNLCSIAILIYIHSYYLPLLHALFHSHLTFSFTCIKIEKSS